MTNELRTDRPGGITVITACVLGFLLGQVLALMGDIVGVGLSHFPGGLDALAHAGEAPWWSLLSSLLGLWIGMVGAIVYASRRGAQYWQPHSFRTTGLGDVWYLVVGVVLQGVIDAAYRPFHAHSLSGPVNHLFGDVHGVMFIVMALLSGIVAPVIEESFFRATMFRALSEEFVRYFPRRGVAGAVVVSSLLFGLAHAELVQLPGLVALGILLAIVYQRTHRLLPSVLIHVGFNAVAVLDVLAHRMH